MTVSTKYTVRGLPHYTQEQIRVMALYDDMTAAGVIACAMDEYYKNAVLGNPALARFRETANVG